MSTPERAGWYYAGRFCKKCEAEIESNDLVIVDADGEYDGEGHAIDLSTVRHAGECPPEE